jgi:hypothetical protein
MPRPPRRKASNEAGEQSTPPRPLQAQHEARGVIRTLYPVPRRRAAPKQKKEASLEDRAYGCPNSSMSLHTFGRVETATR